MIGARKKRAPRQAQPSTVQVDGPVAQVIAPPVATVTSPLTPVQSKKVAKELLEDGWPIRRRVMMAALFYIAGNVQYLIIWGNDTPLNSNIATNLLWCGAGIIGAYVFGAVWDDMDRRDTMLEYDTSYAAPVGIGGAAPNQLDGGG